MCIVTGPATVNRKKDSKARRVDVVGNAGSMKIDAFYSKLPVKNPQGQRMSIGCERQ